MHKVQPACTKSSQHAQSPANTHIVQPACTESSQHAESPASMNGIQEARFRSGLLTARVSGSGFRTMSLRSKSGGTRARCYISRHPHRGRSEDIRRIEGRAFLPGTGQARTCRHAAGKKSSLGSVLGQRRSNLRDGWMDGRLCCRALTNKQHSL